MESSSSKPYVVTLLSFLTLLLLSSLQSASASSRDPRAINNKQTNTFTEFIRTSCVATTYPKLCYSSLSVHASAIQSSPELLATTALGVSLSSARATSASLRQLALSPRGGRRSGPRESAAMRDCLEELADTVDELQKSAAEMDKMVKGKSPSEFGLMMSDVQTWVSAALTDENTCADGFDERSADGGLKAAVRGTIVNVAHLTSNALALINKYAMIHG